MGMMQWLLIRLKPAIKGGLRSSLWRFGLGSFFWKLQIVGREARDCTFRMNGLRHEKCIIGSLI